MGRPIEEFAIAWQALSKVDHGDGWRCISVHPAGHCAVMAARRFPSNQQAMLVGFREVKVPSKEFLPEGVGFEVTREDPHADGTTWIALTKKDDGGAEIFAEMVSDVVGTIDSVGHLGEESILRTLLFRVRAWQEFMRKAPRGLSPEAEIGLAGELEFFGMLLDLGVQACSVVESWRGPLRAPQDFEIGTGAIEVKSSLSSSGFLANVGCLEQLDSSYRSPLYLAAIRFILTPDGRRLGDIACGVLERLTDTPCAHEFLDRLVAAGLPTAHFGRYERRLSFKSIRLLEVTDAFPRLIPGNVAAAIRRVSYQLDLDRVSGDGLCIEKVLGRLGVA